MLFRWPFLIVHDLKAIKRKVKPISTKLSPQIIEHEKITMTYDIGKLGPGLGQQQKCVHVLMSFIKKFNGNSKKELHTVIGHIYS
jgi:hypothetical protein